MKVLIAGDFYPSDRVKELVNNGKYEEVLGEVEPIIKSADYSIVNYESPLVKNSCKPIVKCGPNLASTFNGVEAIKWAGFKMATLANNHIYDYGTEGLNETIKTCTEYGIDFVGVGQNLQEAQRVFYKKIQNKTLAVINCCEHEFSIAETNTPGANPLNPIEQYYQIKEARKYADYVLVIVHGGHELYQLPSPRMVKTYRYFIDVGADVVVNHHQHCYSGYETYQGKPIFYGLGNFCFDTFPIKKDSMWNYGYLLMCDFGTKISFKIYPYIQCAKEAKISLIHDSLIENNLKKLNAIIQDPILLEDNVNAYYKSCRKSIRNMLNPIQNRYYLALLYRGLLPSLIHRKWLIILKNHISCEAHRDKIEYFLKNK